MSVKIDLSGDLHLRRQLDTLNVPAAKRRRLAVQLARKVRVFSRKRLREQRGLDGAAWQKRKRGNKKMLRGLSKRLFAQGAGGGAVVRFYGLTGSIAYRQQHGLDEVMTASRMQKIHGKDDQDKPATKQQARALREEGFKGRVNGRLRKVSLSWISEHFTQAQAGIVLRQLRDEKAKQSWTIPLPARSFLGVTEAERQQLTTELVNSLVARMAGTK